jgi:hypothetical protein
LNNVIPAVTNGPNPVAAWAASYTGTGGKLSITANLSAFSSSPLTATTWSLLKDSVVKATGNFYFNNANVHLDQ